MRYCSSCGAQLGVGRYCVNCGLRVEHPATDHGAWRTDTMERPAVPPEPPAVRFPLYADEAPADGPPAETPAEPDVEALGQPERESLLPMTVDRSDEVPRPTRKQKRLFAVLAGIVTVWALVAVLGVVLLLRSDDGSGSDETNDPTSSESGSTTDPPSAPATRTPEPPAGPPRLVDVARLATARAPATALPTEDVDGALVGYDATNMLDGDPTTCWRAEGDATDDTLVFTLRSPTRITRVGLVNGYAKTVTDGVGNTLDWYAGNRRVLAVEWEFDDGSTVQQELREVRRLQTVRVPRVTSTTVRLKLLSVSEPGEGLASRDNTPISEVSVIGRRVRAGA